MRRKVIVSAALRATALAVVPFALAILSPAAVAQSIDGPADCTEPAKTGVSVTCAKLAAIDAAAEQMVASNQTPGIAVAVVHRGKIVLKKGYGKANLEFDIPVTSETVFSIFSATKAFTAAGIMTLVEQGKIGLDDPLAKYFPHFPRSEQVRVRDLLSHTSGIHDYVVDFPYEKTGIEPEKFVEYIARQKPAFEFSPGTQWKYSNSNYVLLGAIIERVTKQSYRDYLSRSVIAKARLKNTAVDRNLDVVENRASGYMREPEVPDGDFVRGTYIDFSVPYAAGNIRSTLEDMIRFYSALYSGRVVSPETTKLMMTSARVKDGRLAGDAVFGGEPGSFDYWGLGVATDEYFGRKYWGSGGNFYSFSSSTHYFPGEDLLLVALANTGGAAPWMTWWTSKIIFEDPAGIGGSEK